MKILNGNKNKISMSSRPRTVLLWAVLAVFLFAVTVLLANDAIARPAIDSDGILIAADEAEDIIYGEKAEISAVTGSPVALYQVNYPVRPASPEAMAEQYLSENAAVLGLNSADLGDLAHKATRESLSGATVRYTQNVAGVPVYKGEIVVHINNDNKVSMVTANYRPSLALGTTPTISGEEARQLAHDYLQVSGDLYYDVTSLTVYDFNETTRLAYQVRVETDVPAGNWELLVDAHSGEIFKVDDDSFYNVLYSENTIPSTETNLLVDGTGYVFDPDPLTSATATYGDAGFVDGNDATTPQLDAERFQVTLSDIDLNAGTYTLIGPWAEITDWAAPFKGLFSQPSDQFLFNRFEDGFEASNTYYHIDFYMRYLNNTLGLTIEPHQYPGGVQFDPHGFNGADNSSYSTGTGRLQFGEGGVDDAEDSDVVHHELGHGLHDWVTNGSLSQVNGLSEGTGDYAAQSYNRDNESWTPADPAYHWVFRWDGHNPFWPGRVTNYGPTWPGGLTGQIHTDGQIWATCNMKVYDAIGKAKTDTAFWEGLSNTNSGTNQSQAANAVYQAAIDLGYSISDLNQINTIYGSCGYLMPPPPTGPDFDVVEVTGNLEICQPDDAIYTVGVTSIFGYNGVVTLSVSGEPAGTSTSFSPNGQAAPYTSTLTIGNTGAAALGNYTLSISGASATATHTTTVGLTVSDLPGAVTLTAPADGSTGQSTTPTFQWTEDPAADSYTLEVATDAGFANIVINQSGINTNSYDVTTPLAPETTYYWRVFASGFCGDGAYSSVFDFTTQEAGQLIYMPAVLKP